VGLKSQFESRRRDARWVAAALAALLGLLTLIYYLVQRSRDLPSTLVTNQVLLFVLRNANALLILVILFVLARNLLRLWLERRNRVLGARFKTKLVATYVGLALVPVLALFVYASELLQGSIDRWFSSSLRGVLEQSFSIAQELQQEIAERDWRDAGRLARQIQPQDLADAKAREALARRLATWRLEIGADLVAIYEETDFVQAVVDPSSGLEDLPEVRRSFLLQAAEQGRAQQVLVPPGARSRLIVSAAAGAQPAGQRRIVVAVGTLLQPETAERTARLIDAYQSYRQLEIQKGQFKASYLLMFVLVTLVILLASSWLGLFLARRLMAPVLALAEGTRRISLGDLDHRIEVAADDEMAGVVESFNRMTEELARNRALIETKQQELMEANTRLDGERDRLSAILDNLAAGVLALDGEGRFVAANGAAQRMLRQREDELVGHRFEEAWGDPERSRLGVLLDPAETARPRRPAHVSLVLAGERRTFEAKVTELPGGGGRPAGTILVLEDLTELIKAQKLAAWTEAARRIAHEIKNPLTPIRLAAERLRARCRGGDTDMPSLVEEAVDIIVREVGAMQSLVDEFSRYARMTGPQLTETPVDRLVSEVVALFRDVKEGVEVVARVETSVGDAWIDVEQIRRVLINLLDNAVEATAAPGRIEVRAERQRDTLVIAVADSGRGIPAEDRDKLFLPFFSRKGRGTGMGLAIVHRIVSDHSGTIRIGDNSPKGSVFTIELPAGGRPRA